MYSVNDSEYTMRCLGKRAYLAECSNMNESLQCRDSKSSNSSLYYIQEDLKESQQPKNKEDHKRIL